SRANVLRIEHDCDSTFHIIPGPRSAKANHDESSCTFATMFSVDAVRHNQPPLGLMTPTTSWWEIVMLLSILCVGFGAVVGALARFFITHLSSELSHHRLSLWHLNRKRSWLRHRGLRSHLDRRP